jgi:23S rRNA G2445 N2-methylase RlmL
MPRANIVDNLRLVGVSGTNKVMAGELSRLAKRASIVQRLGVPGKEGTGALVYPFDPDVAVLAVRYHRTSVRVLWDLFQSRAERLEPLYDDLLALMRQESRPWLGSKTTISVNAHGMRDFAAGERQVVGTVKNAIVDGAKAEGREVTVDPDSPDVFIGVRYFEGVVTVAVDLAGRPMNQRGYRGTTGTAPLRENVAAVLVMLGRHDARTEPLIDPMAGTGTIVIEAAGMANASTCWIPPREPACHTLAPFRERFTDPAAPLFADTRPFVIANELVPGIHHACMRHVARTPAKPFVEIRKGDFRKLDPDELRARCRLRGFDGERGLILSNPPYGERIGDRDLLRLYRDLGSWCRRFHGWRAAFLVANPDFERQFGGQPRIKKPLSNGPLRGYFLMYDL